MILNDNVTLVDELRARGVRITPQRAMVLYAIETMPGHSTAEEIHEVVRRQNPHVNLATIYRTLEMLRDLQLVSEADMGDGSLRFSLHSHATHHHAICRRCKHSFEFPAELLSPIAASLRSRYNFTADVNHMVVFGVCQHCAKEGRPDPS